MNLFICFSRFLFLCPSPSAVASLWPRQPSPVVLFKHYSPQSFVPNTQSCHYFVFLQLCRLMAHRFYPCTVDQYVGGGFDEEASIWKIQTIIYLRTALVLLQFTLFLKPGPRCHVFRSSVFFFVASWLWATFMWVLTTWKPALFAEAI